MRTRSRATHRTRPQHSACPAHAASPSPPPSRLGNLVLKPFGIPPASDTGHAPHSERELRELLRESREGGLIEREEQQLSEAALVFGDRRAREVMTPRAEINFVTTDQSPRAS
jgi:CBS domain containing-hemolysin-like protein